MFQLRFTIAPIAKLTMLIPMIFLVGCEPNIDDVAAQNGCGGLKRDMHKVFVLAGWWKEAQRDIKRHEDRYGTDSNLYRIVEEQKFGGYGMYNRSYFHTVEAFFQHFEVGSETLGDILVASMKEQFSDDFFQVKSLSGCTEYLNIMMSEASYINQLGEYYTFPAKYDEYK